MSKNKIIMSTLALIYLALILSGSGSNTIMENMTVAEKGVKNPSARISPYVIVLEKDGEYIELKTYESSHYDAVRLGSVIDVEFDYEDFLIDEISFPLLEDKSKK